MSDSFGNFPSAGPQPGSGYPLGGGRPGGGHPGAGHPGAGGPIPRSGPPPGRGPDLGPVPGSGVGPRPGQGGDGPTQKRRSTKESEGPKPTRRLISRQVIIATIFALIAGVVVVFMLTDEPAHEYVVRTTSDVPAGTALTAGLLEATPLPNDAIEPNAFSASTGEEALEEALAELEGTVTQFPLPAKSQIRTDQFGFQTTLGAGLAPNERLVSIRATVSTAVAGGLSVGDRVDIFGATDGRARIVAYDVPIMSITVSEDGYNSVADQQAADPELRPEEALPSDPVPGIYVVKVPAEILPTIINWNESASLYLAYRGSDAISIPVEDSTLEDDSTGFFNDHGYDTDIDPDVEDAAREAEEQGVDGLFSDEN